MSEFSLFGQLDQVSDSEAGKVFRVCLRCHVRDLICRVMAQEVSLLCGLKHLPTGGGKFRSDGRAAPGSDLIFGFQSKFPFDLLALLSKLR